MPAVTADTMTLPRIPCPDPTAARPRPVESVTTAPKGFEREGFPVRSANATATPTPSTNDYTFYASSTPADQAYSNASTTPD
jgi:hypothetical protein